MKKLIAIAALAATCGLMAFAAETTTVKGYIMDSKCSTNAKMKGNAECAKTCVGKGDTAVLVADTGDKVYKIANQDKIKDNVGDHVTVTGTVDADNNITVTKVSKSSAPKASGK